VTFIHRFAQWKETKEPAMIVMFLMEKLISVEAREWSTKESDKFAI
jgi:hypothetical protein